MSLKGNAILQDTFPDGSSVSFACNVGYTTVGGSATITCTAGSWSPLRLVCESKLYSLIIYSTSALNCTVPLFL